MEKPVVYNWKKAEERIKELEKAVDVLSDILNTEMRGESFWHEEELGIWCDNCESFFYFGENLDPSEKLFSFCPDCGAMMCK